MRWPPRKISYSLLTLVVVFGVPEAGLRLFWTPPTSSREVGTRRFVRWLSDLSLGRDVSEELYRPDADLLWALRPSVRFESVIQHRLRRGEEQGITITINADGYRGKSVAPAEPASGETRVLCLGDSNFFGYPLDDVDGFPAALERALARRADEPVSVLNAGVPGYSVLQGRIWYDRVFDGHDYDWLLLSFVNNDAWLQPASDASLLERRRPAWLGRLSDSVRLVQWARSVFVRAPPREAWVPRVSLQRFDETYRTLIERARRKQARVMILDFRAHAEYEPYSDRLRRIAEEERVIYLPIAERVARAFEDPATFERHADLADRVRRRWTATGLRLRPHLRYYAEVEPEHLNEVGVAWLADVVAEMLLAPGAGPA